MRGFGIVRANIKGYANGLVGQGWRQGVECVVGMVHANSRGGIAAGFRADRALEGTRVRARNVPG